MAKKDDQEQTRRPPLQSATVFLEVYGPDDYVDRATGEVKTARAHFRISGVIGGKDDPDRVSLSDIRAPTPADAIPLTGVMIRTVLERLEHSLMELLQRKARGH